MNAFFFISLLLFCLHVFGWKQDINGININVEEQSAKITISNGINKIAVSFKKIIEIDRYGAAVGLHSALHHTFKNFEYTTFDSSAPTETLEVVAYDKNVTAIRKNFTAILQGPAAVFNLQVLIYDNHTWVANANKTEYYTVYNGTVQFTFSIHNWPFCGIKGFKCESKIGEVEIGEYLDVYIAIEGLREKATVGYTKSFSNGGHKPDTYDFGGSDVTFSNKYFVNNTWFEMKNGYPRITQEDKKNVAIIRFPTFYTSAYYDPMINVSSHVYSASVRNSCSWYIMSVIFFIVSLTNYYSEE